MVKRLLFLFLSMWPMLMSAQIMACRNVIKDGYDFWLYLPEDYDASSAPKPVVMFLHGKSLCGDDLALVRHYGCINAIERGRDINAIVVAPQTQTTWNPSKLNEVYEWVKTHYKVDTNRFYVLGMSLGGYGTLDFVATYPDKIAAAMAMCGGATTSELCGLTKVPLWIMHGTADTAVPVRCSEKVVNAMIDCGDTSRLVFDKLKHVNHTRLSRVFYLKQTYDWLFSHSLNDSARVVNRAYSMNNSILNAAYDDLDNTSKVQVLDSKSASYIYRNEKYYVVKKGDTLSQIAVENDTTVSILCKLNNIDKNSQLRIGKKLRVK